MSALSSTKPQAWTLSPQMTAAPELWRGVILCLPLWEGVGGVAKDLSPVGADADFLTGPSWTLGQNGRAVSFNGTGHIEGALETSDATFTWSWWSYTDTVEQKWMWASDGNLSGWGFGSFDSQGEFRAYTGSSSARFAGNAGDVVAGEWQHWVVIYANSAVKAVYRNGLELTPSANNSSAMDPRTKHEFGGQASSFWVPWSGELDLPIVWDRELSSSEIKSLAHDPFAMLRPAGF